MALRLDGDSGTPCRFSAAAQKQSELFLPGLNIPQSHIPPSPPPLPWSSEHRGLEA
jgi:hypothetical protein